MKRQKANPWRILLCSLVLVFSCQMGWAANNPSQGKSASFFSQGQAVYNPQDRAQSQQDAIHDFLVQAVTQALGTYFSPAQMGSQFAPLQEKILKQPERYVETYQIFSESPSGGLYRVTGQATVAMESLKKDLARFGLPATGGTPPAPASAQEESKPETATPPSEAQPPQAVAAVKSGREKSSSRKKFLWVVPERWNREWYLPRDRRDPHGLFALSILQESQDYEWSLVFPESSAMSVDTAGKVSQNQAVALAGTLGVQSVVLGTMDLQPKGNRDASLSVSLRVVDVASGKGQGEIFREMDLGGTSDQQGAMEMAFAIVPRLDRLLREPKISSESAQPAKEATQPAVSSESFKGEGEWTLVMRSDHQYAYWEDLAKILRTRFKSMRVRSLELGADEAKVKLDGVDGDVLTSLQGTQVREGVKVQVEGLSPEMHSLRVTFVPSEAPGTEPAQ